MVMVGLAISLSVWGDTSTVTISNASARVTSSASTTVDFPISRGPDTSYDAFVQYQTQDGTAIAGTDHTAAGGSIVIPAGTTSTTIPVTITGSTSNPADKTFQMLLLGGGGAARTFTADFAAQQTFGTGGAPHSATAADLNGDGRPELIATNIGVSLWLYVFCSECGRLIDLAEGNRQQRDVVGPDIIRHAVEEHAAWLEMLGLDEA